MKSINYKLLSVLLLVGMLFLTYCKKDFLDRYPLDSPVPQTFFVNEASAKLATNAIYNPITRQAYMYERDFVMMNDDLTDDSYWRPSRAISIQFSKWDFDAAHDNVLAYWRYPYQSINLANFAIENIPQLLKKNLTQATIDPYIAEARFLRAFCYMDLVSFYGSVPLIDHTLSKFEEFSQPRAPVADVYNLIISDFTFARDKLPTAWPTEYTGSPTQAAAAAYLAKAYLYNKDFVNAETAARSAITTAEAAGYHLVDDYMSIFDINNEANPELLFYFAYIENVLGFGENFSIQRNCRQEPPAFQSVWGSGWGYALPMRDLYDAYEPGDPRRGYTIFAPGDFFGIYTSSTPFTYTHKKYDSTGQLISWDKTYNAGDSIVYDYRWSPTGMNTRKSIYNIANVVDEYRAGLDIPLMRMADLYLILAEALAEQNKDEALVWVNKVRARPSVNMTPKTTSDGSLRDIVRHERRVELAMEGNRLFDLLRWGEVKNVFGDGTQVKRHFYSDYLPPSDPTSRFASPNLSRFTTNVVLFPIPQSEMDLNKNIGPQNPGY